jgi:hypothetical protein
MEDDDRCAEARKFRRIHAAFEAGDLDALRAAVEDPAVVPNGVPHRAIGPCLCYAVYHSPVAFIRTLLSVGADPNVDADGFPPLVAALSCVRGWGGVPGRPDVDEILIALLEAGADPNQRGINDYTPLHMAVSEGSLLAAQRLLDAGADPGLRTRIDECETPHEMAERAGRTAFAAFLARRGRPLARRLRSGVTLLADVPGEGPIVRRQQSYRTRTRTWLADGTAVPPSPPDAADPAAGAQTSAATLCVNRGRIIPGLFYGLDGMRVGGMRRLALAPHMAFGERGLPGRVPPGAGLIVEVVIVSALDATA